MQPLLKVTTLGGLRITLDDEPVTGFVSRKVEALLVYLATNPREHPREVLGEMLWDDLPQHRTMSYLRTALSSLQKQLSPYINVTRQTIGIDPESNYWIDTAELDAALDAAEQKWEQRENLTRLTASTLENALELYHGSFLDGFHIRNGRGFEGWMVLEQERLRNRVLEAFYRLGTYSLERGAHSSGINHTTQALQIDPLWEEAHRQMMILLVQSGQRNAALMQYETCREILEEELGIEPDEETTALFEQIQAGDFSMTFDQETPNNLPAPATPFIAREAEKQRIGEQLDRPDCRLLTLVGPGGIGKSRLALEVAQNVLMDYQHGVYFINFVPGRNPDPIANGIANVLNLMFRHDRSPEEELIHNLRDKEMLLVLDNLDEVLHDVDFLSRLIRQAPSVKFLTTARERLNLQEEWLFPVDSLAVPPSKVDENTDLEKFGSVQLFVQSAQRMQADFSLNENRDSVVAICRMVEGVPLAIELAASWMRMMEADQIVTEIRSGLDILTTSLRNVPERHRSMRAVFESSWEQLGPAEQRAFRQLAVFRGGFNARAAQYITEATIFTLSALVDKSLVYTSEGRYWIHELLRQFAEEKLAEWPDEDAQVTQQHAEYYAGFMCERARRLTHNHPHSAYIETIDEIDNVWAAWHHALEPSQPELIDQFLMAFYCLHDMQSRYREGLEVFQEALKSLDAEEADELSVTQARATMLMGACLQNLTHLDEGEQYINKALPVLDAAGEIASWESRLARHSLGNIAYSRGDYITAREHFRTVRDRLEKDAELDINAMIFFRLSDIEAVMGNYEAAKAILAESRPHVEQHGGTLNMIRYAITMGDIEYKLGDYDEAHQCFREGLDLSQSVQATTSEAVALVSLGRAAMAIGNYDEAKALCQQSVSVCDEIRNMWGKAFALMQLGRCCGLMSDYAEAMRYLRQCLEICENINVRWIKAAALRYQSEISLYLGDRQEAFRALCTAVDLALEIHAEPLAVDILSGAASIVAWHGDHDAAALLSAFVLQHPVSEFDSRATAERLLKHIDHQAVKPDESLTLERAARKIHQLCETMLAQDVPSGKPFSLNLTDEVEST